MTAVKPSDAEKKVGDGFTQRLDLKLERELKIEISTPRTALSPPSNKQNIKKYKIIDERQLENKEKGGARSNTPTPFLFFP